MPRTIPEYPDQWNAPNSNFECQKIYEIQLITPMFGGGVESRVNDKSFPIRPTAVRGQLQFWWRATAGARYDDIKTLREEQSKLWGDTSRPSLVQVQIKIKSIANPTPCASFERDPRNHQQFASMATWRNPFAGYSLSYVLFPFQGQLAAGRQSIEVQPASFIEKARFQLTIKWHKDVDYTKEIEPALWAWMNFGGLGSRTRRGCGAIFCEQMAPENADDLITMMNARINRGGGPPPNWPTLAGEILTKDPFGNPIEAWDKVIAPFKHFRQGSGLGRNQGEKGNRPGRSRFPEPETIRRVTRTRYNGHPRMEGIPDNAFPRAELGLPIVFHFKDRGEPSDTVLYPSNDSNGNRRERMASPLILKPLQLKNGRSIPLILQLKTPVLDGVDLRQGDRSLDFEAPPLIRDQVLSAYNHSPLNGSESGSAIEAFLAYALKTGFQRRGVQR